MAFGLPPPIRMSLSIINTTRIKKGNAKQSLLCHGDDPDAIKALCRPQIHKMLYDIIVNHFK